MNSKPIQKSVEKVVTLLKNKCNGKLSKPELKTGFYKIDYCLNEPNLIVLAGTRGIGKTALALNIAKNLTVNENISVGYISLEASEENLIERLLSIISGIDAWRIRTGYLDNDVNRDTATIDYVAETLSNKPLFIEDVASPSFLEIKKIAKSLLKKDKIKVLVIDYLQLIYDIKSATPKQTTELVQKIKVLAVELKIPIILLVEIEEYEKIIPLSVMLRKLGNIEKFADTVIFIKRNYEDIENNAELIFEKNDCSSTGKMDVVFDGNISSFTEYKPPVCN